jgi:hypothetical protein
MPYPTPSTPTLDQISTNDFINYAGVKYPVASVTAHVYTSAVIQTATIVISVNSQNVTLNLTSADTVISETYITQDGTAHTSWKQTAVYN